MRKQKTKRIIIIITIIVVFIFGILIGNWIEKNKEESLASQEEITRIVEVEVGTRNY